INVNDCSITEEMILAEQDEGVRDILAGLLTLHEDLQFRETERVVVVERLRELTDNLERRVREQSQAIMELSTPVLEVWTGVLVLPLVGAVDTKRAGQILVQALERAAGQQSTVFLIDVTGVPVIDTSVARHLLTTIDALKLLGTETILTGVSPTNAQTLAGLGIDLGGIRTRASLHAGLRHALSLVEQGELIQRH
ncbi:MAG: STAS domain-containing protein, partial [Deltaproteobacteria bacterium]|nr:STAS domain-containing protein [Deltaproteobacteria bacterium]